MPPHDKTPTEILIQIAGDIGETREGISNLKENVSTLTEDMKEIKDQLLDTVPKSECTQRHVVIAQSLDRLKTELLTEFKKSPSSTAYQAITPSMLKPGKPATVEEVEAALEKKKEEKKEKTRKLTTFWLATIFTAAVLISGLVAGLYKFFLYLAKIDESLTSTKQEIRDEIKHNQSKTVYIKVPMYPDAGEPSYSPVPKRIPSKTSPKR